MSLEAWKTTFEIGGVILLFLTFVFGAGVLFTSTRINARQAEELRQFSAKLTGAQTELSRQQERAANADARVAGLEKAATDAKTVQQKVEAELARQQEKTASAERALLELQERVKPRHSSTVQRSQLVELLSHAAKGPLRVSHIILDEEGRSFAMQVADALTASGWSPGEVEKSMYSSGPIAVGIVLMVRDANEAPSHLKVLFDAFTQVGLSPSLGVNPSTPEGTVEVAIGIKP